MAKKKKQFCPFIYPEWGELFDAITVEQRAELLLAITKFPEYEPKNVPIWNFIKSQLQKDYENFVEKCEKNSEISQNYWEQKKANVSERIPNETERHPKLKPLTKTLTLTEAKEASPEISNLNLSEWYGEYCNVHLTKRQYDLLLNEILDKSKLDELIGELSENIACNNGKAPPYDEKKPDMHFAILRKYWRWRKQNGFKPPATKENKAIAFKNELDALTEKYRAKELRSG